MGTLRYLRCLIAPLLGALLATATHAQDDYPDKPVHVIVPFAAGGAVDPLARVVSERLSRQTGQTFFVENRPGAGGRIGTDSVIRSTADGYTLLAAPSGIAINPLLYPKGAYDLVKDFTPLGVINRIPMLLVVSPKSGIKTFAELVKTVRDKPGSVDYGITGIGTLDHLAYEHLRTTLELNMVRIDYVGVAQALNAMYAGDIPTMVIALSAALPHIRSGKLVPLAITSAQRVPTLPDVPTMAEAGVPNFVMYGWSMFFAPSATPAPLVQKLHDEVAKAVASPEVNKFILDGGGEPVDLSLPELKEFVRQNTTFFGNVIQNSNIKVK